MVTLKIAYFDCFSGISGDMCLGAIVDSGISLKKLDEELKRLPVTGYRLSARKVKRSHIIATKVDVRTDHRKSGDRQFEMKRWKDIEKIILKSSLAQGIKQKGLKIFQRLFEAEARVHGKRFNTVHLHELGAIDCLIDIFGTVIGLNLLGIEKILSSPLNLGSGCVKTETGIFPVPAPATAEILKNVPVYSEGISSELTTPTGAAIIKELSSGYCGLPLMDIEQIGSGAGSNNFQGWPNVLRMFVGSMRPVSGGEDESVIVIETNIDDMNPQLFEYVTELLNETGALDIYLPQVIMKKGRPGVKLTVLCNEEHKVNLMKIILKETSTIGLRFYETERRVLQREIKSADTRFGKVRVKVSKFGNEILRVTPEYEDCRRIAKRLHIPLIEFMKKIQSEKWTLT
jgi:hypothetical protein